MDESRFASGIKFDPVEGFDRLGRPVHIRVFAPDDATALSELYRCSVRGLGPLFYSEQQVSAWESLAPSPDQLVTRYDGERLGLVATNVNEGLIAFADLDGQGSIGFLYSHPQWARTGAVELLYLCLEQAARTAGIRTLHVEASELARRFFARRGFRWIKRQEITLGSVQIHNHRMEKVL